MMGLSPAFSQTGASTGPARIVMGGRAVGLVANAVYAFPSARNRVIAVGGTDQGLGTFLEAIAPGFNQKPELDRNAGAEHYAALRPDLAIFKTAMKARVGAGLDALKINSLYLELETPDDYYRDLANLGQVLGETARAQELIAYYREIVQRTTAIAAAGPARPRVLVVQSSQGNLQVPPDSWMQTIMVELAGGTPVWKGSNPGSGWATVNPEQVAAWNPEVILIVSYSEAADRQVTGFKADARYRALQAVRSNRVFGFPQDFYSWDQPDTRWGLGLLWVSKTLHPQAAATLNLETEARRFFGLFYQMTEAAFDRHVKPRLSGL